MDRTGLDLDWIGVDEAKVVGIFPGFLSSDLPSLIIVFERINERKNERTNQ